MKECKAIEHPQEGLHEAYAWFLRVFEESEICGATDVLDLVKTAFTVAFMKGVMWTMEQRRQRSEVG